MGQMKSLHVNYMNRECVYVYLDNMKFILVIFYY